MTVQTKKIKMSFDMLRQMVLIMILVGICIVWAIMTPSFLTVSNITNVVRQVSYTAIAAVGMTMIIIIGEIDLSAGSLIAIAGLVAAYVFKATGSMALAVLAVIVVSAIVGIVNGVLVTKGKLPGFIATLAAMTILRGFAYIFTKGNPIAVSDKKFLAVGTGYLGMIPIPVIIMVIIVALGIFLTNNTRFGRYIYAVGGNAEASKWSGLNVDKVKILVFLIMGVVTGISGLVVAARLGSGQPSAGTSFEMDCITAAVVGGTSMAGGKGTILGTVVGALIIGVLGNGMTLLDVNTYWQQVIKGVIIVIAVLIDTKTKKR
jgi:ribose transport system permease protein